MALTSRCRRGAPATARYLWSMHANEKMHAKGLKWDDEEAKPTWGVHKRLCRLRGRCKTQCRAGAKAALVLHSVTKVVKARAAVRRRPAAKHMKWLSTHSTL